MTKDSEILLQRILHSIDLIERKMQGVTVEKFVGDEELQDVIQKQLSQMSQTVRQLPEFFSQNTSQIDSGLDLELRNMLVKNKLDVELAEIWNIIERDLQPFRDQIEELLYKDN